MKIFPITICAVLFAAPSFADVRVQFFEGAPKDKFIITNEGACDIGATELIIDFSGSRAGLIFDVTASGAGVEVFQPFEVTEGANALASEPAIADGDQTATILIKNLDVNQRIAFTIDVDDTKGAREITVSDDEISGTTISLTTQGKQVLAVLGTNAEVLLTTGACTT